MSKENITNYGKSNRSKLLNIAKKEDVFFQTVLTRYFQERFLYRMSQTVFRNHFFLKGGALMFAYEKLAARPTLDIDFLGHDISNEAASIINVFRKICSFPCEEDGVTFDTGKITAQNITELKDYHGIRLSIPVSMDTISQVMTMDIGFGDVITPHPIELDYPILLDHLPGANILAYSIKTVIAEKMHAVIDLADQNSRMKDYYDLYHILKNEKYDSAILQDAVIHTFENRHLSYDGNTMFFREEFGESQQMQVSWQAFLRKINRANVFSFKEVVSFLKTELLPYWENMANDKNE